MGQTTSASSATGLPDANNGVVGRSALTRTQSLRGSIQYRARRTSRSRQADQDKHHSVHIIESIPTEMFLSRQRQYRAWQQYVSVFSFGFYPYTNVCVSTVYSGGIRTHDPCNSRAVSYQLDYRDCPGS